MSHLFFTYILGRGPIIIIVSLFYFLNRDYYKKIKVNDSKLVDVVNPCSPVGMTKLCFNGATLAKWYSTKTQQTYT